MILSACFNVIVSLLFVKTNYTNVYKNAIFMLSVPTLDKSNKSTRQQASPVIVSSRYDRGHYQSSDPRMTRRDKGASFAYFVYTVPLSIHCISKL